MEKKRYTDFTAALGEEYCEVVGPLTEFGATPQDGYEVFGKLFGFDAISPEKLHAAQVSKQELIKLCDIARTYHEYPKITTEHIREILRRTLWRWPPEAT